MGSGDETILVAVQANIDYIPDTGFTTSVCSSTSVQVHLSSSVTKELPIESNDWDNVIR